MANAIHFTPPADYLKFVKFPDATLAGILQHKVPGNEIPKPGNECYVWVKKGDALTPVKVTAGLFDGSFIEISGDINVGDDVITGIGTNTQAVSGTANNPFMPKMKPATNKK